MVYFFMSPRQWIKWQPQVFTSLVYFPCLLSTSLNCIINVVVYFPGLPPLWHAWWISIIIPLMYRTARWRLKVVSIGSLKHGSRMLHQKQLSRAGTSNYIPQQLRDVITCTCPWYLRLAQHSWYHIPTGTKWLTFCWRHFELHFSQRKTK